MDPDQSNASEAFWRSGSINRVGLGRVALGFLLSFQLLDFLAMFTHVSCYVDLPCVLISSQKSQKNYYVFLICFWLFYDIFTCLRLVKIICVNFSFDLYILCVFVWIFLYDFWSKICHVMLMFGTWFYDEFTSDLVLIHSIVLVDFCLQSCNSFNCVS